MADEEEAIFKRVLRRKITEGKKSSKKKQGRPVKKIDVERVIDRLKKGISKTEVAASQHVSVATLNRRLDEAGVKIEAEIKVFQKNDEGGKE